MLKNKYKISILTLTTVAVLLAGCSNDQRYKREIEGNKNYLDSPDFRTLNVPAEVVVPARSDDYAVYKSALKEGATGVSIDIRPPAQPIPTMDDAYAVYRKSVVSLDAPGSSDILGKIPAILQNKAISFQQNGHTIEIHSASVHRADEDVPAELSYMIRSNSTGYRQNITFELTGLSRSGEALTSDIEKQRYAVGFFNMLMVEMSDTKPDADLNLPLPNSGRIEHSDEKLLSSK